MKKNIIILTSFTLILTLIVAATFMWHSYKSRYFSCSANYHSQYREYSLQAVIHYIFNGDTGIMTLDGEIQQINGDTLHIRIRNNFEFEKNNHTYNLLSKNISIMPSTLINVEKLDLLLPNFYFMNKKSLSYILYPQQDGNVIFSSGKLPAFYCMKD